MTEGLLLLDRDGVLNAVVVDAEHGTIDSPLHPDQVRMIPGVAGVLAELCAAGWGLAIVSNQPAWAKGKTSRANLDAVHAAVVSAAEAEGARVLSSHLCLHRREDGCACRKPRTALLEEALAAHPAYRRELSWMVGDGVTDVEAGVAAGLRTAFLGPRKCDACRVFEDRRLTPDFWGEDLAVFARSLLGRG